MASSGYTLWSVVAGEQPTTAKWNILGGNDASFNSGVGFNDAAVVARHLSASALGAIYPVGCIYTSTVATNPATVFGFGTWVAYAQGQVMAGFLSGDPDFGSTGQTGGAKTHFHWQTVGSDNGTGYIEIDGSGSGHTRVISPFRATFSSGGGANAGSREDGTYDSSSFMPYVTVFIWRRTA